MDLPPEDYASWPPPRSPAELIEHLELVPGAVVGRTGAGEAGITLTARVRSRRTGRKRTVLLDMDVEMLRHVSALLPDMCLAAVEEFNVHQMRASD